MAELTDPILKDASRVISHHPDLTPAFKTRLLLGLAERDRELADRREPQAEPVVAEPVVAEPVKRGRR